MLNPIQVAGLAIISLLLLLQLQFASKHDRPVLWILTLVFFVYFVYSGGIKLKWNIREWSYSFDVSEYYLTLATWLVVVLIIATRCGYSLPQKVMTRARHGDEIYNQSLLLLLSVLGLGTMGLIFYLNGDLVEIWGRAAQGPTIPWAGVLSGLTGLALIYPLFAYYYIESLTPSRLVGGLIILAIYGGLAAFSGVATSHIMRLTPFLLVWLSRRNLTFVRAVSVLLAGFVVFSFFRFDRQLGVTMYLGGGLKEAYTAYSDPANPLNAANSFGEFVAFSQAVKVVDKNTGWQLGGSYLLAPIELVPGVLLPEKSEMLARLNAGTFLPSYYGLSMATWPIGFYGEAYINFGLPGLIALSLLFGWLVRKSEILLKSQGSFFWLPHWYISCLLVATLIVQVRNDSVEAVGFVIPIGIAIILGESISLLLPCRLVRIEQHEWHERSAVG